jgi:integrase
MTRLLADIKITRRFKEHDLRAKCASDAETLERARQLLGHADARITERVYRRKPEVVRPQL